MRLKNSWEFDAVFRAGRQLRGELVRICYLYKDGDTKIGVAVGKKTANAVGRARGRRMLREAWRRLMPWVKDGLWVVASLRKRALDANAVSIYYETAAIMERYMLLNGDWNGADWRADAARHV
jgi:ribonuclease P protein component